MTLPSQGLQFARHCPILKTCMLCYYVTEIPNLLTKKFCDYQWNASAIKLEKLKRSMWKVCPTVHHWWLLINPFVTSGTYISHLQRVFSSPLGWQYPTFSPCCHLHVPWSISIPLNQSECILPRNSHVQMILCAMLHYF